MNSRNNRSIDMKPNNVRNSDFMSILYSQPLREYKKPKFGIGDRVRISKLESFEYGFIYNRVGFQRIFAALSKQHSQFIYKFLAGASEFGWAMGGSNFRDFLPINVPKHYRGEIYVLR